MGSRGRERQKNYYKRQRLNGVKILEVILQK